MKINVKALEGAARIEMLKAEMSKPLAERDVLLKGMTPGIERIGYDAVMKSFEVESGEFSHDVAEFLKTAKASDDLRVLEYVGSTERRDRDGDRIMVNGWDVKEWKKSPMFLWVHGWGGYPPGVGMKVWKDAVDAMKALKFWILYPNDLESDEAQKFTDLIWTYYSHKPPMLKAVSVGFKPTELELGGSPEEKEKLDIGQYGALISKAELWELSGCPIGSNYDAQLVGVAKKMFGARKGPKILDAMGFEVPEGKVWVSGLMEPEAPDADEAATKAIKTEGEKPKEEVGDDNQGDAVNKDIDDLRAEQSRLKIMVEDVSKKLDELKELLIQAVKPAEEKPPAAAPPDQPEEEETPDDLFSDISQDVLAEAAQEVYLDPLEDLGEEERETLAEPADLFDEISQ